MDDTVTKFETFVQVFDHGVGNIEEKNKIIKLETSIIIKLFQNKIIIIIFV